MINIKVGKIHNLPSPAVAEIGDNPSVKTKESHVKARPGAIIVKELSNAQGLTSSLCDTITDKFLAWVRAN